MLKNRKLTAFILAIGILVEVRLIDFINSLKDLASYSYKHDVMSAAIAGLFMLTYGISYLTKVYSERLNSRILNYYASLIAAVAVTMNITALAIAII